MSKGDRITVTYSTGTGQAGVSSIEARQNGRKVYLEQSKTEISVIEVTRGGTQVRRVWFPTSAVLCIDSEMRGDE